MKIIDVSQGSSEWHSFRQTGIGASEIAAIVGESPYKDALDVYNEKLGITTPFINEHMKRGTEYEPVARSLFEEDMGLTFVPLCVRHDEIDYCIASLDGYNALTNTILEIKVPTPENWERLTCAAMPPKHYQWQVQWQLLASGADSCYWIAYNTDSSEYHCFLIERDVSMQERALNAVKTFWEENLEAGVPPVGKQLEEYIEIEDDALQPLCEEYLKFCEMKRIAEEEIKVIKKKIVDFGDGGNFKAYGLRATWTASRETYDMEAMKADGVDISKYVKPAKTLGYYTITKAK